MSAQPLPRLVSARRELVDEFGLGAGSIHNMTQMTTRIQSVSMSVADQDRALAFYADVLGCQLRADVELWPGARWV